MNYAVAILLLLAAGWLLASGKLSSAFDLLDSRDPARHAHTKSMALFVTVVVAVILVVAVIRKYEINLPFALVLIALLGMPWGLNGYKSFLNSRKTPEAVP